MAAYKKTDLFGGAITVELPVNFEDVSEIRQVPDTQEVYVDKNGLSSIVFDIAERIEPPEYPCQNDQEALEFHYKDMVSSGYRTDKPESEIEDASKIWSSASAQIISLGPSVHAYTLVGTQAPASNSGNDSNEGKDHSLPAEFTAILFTLIRLEEKETDLLIYVNVPHEQGQYDRESINLAEGKMGPSLSKALETRDRIFKSFAIEHWDLFG